MATIEVVAHPEYLQDSPTYDKISRFVDGDVTRVSKYLIQYDSERPNTDDARRAWESRKERLTNENEVDPPLQVNLSHLNQPLNFGVLADNETMKPIIEDVTGLGCSAQEMFKKKLSLYMQHGKVAVLVDGPSKVADSKAQAQEAGERSYQVLYSAAHILDWKVFTKGSRRGQLAEVVLCEEPYKSDGDKWYKRLVRFYFPSGYAAGRDEVFWKQELQAQSHFTTSVYNETVLDYPDKPQTYDIMSDVPGGLKQIPLVIIGDGLKDSAMRAVTHENEALLNLRSILDNVLYYQGYQRNIGTGMKPEDIKSVAEYLFVTVDNEKAAVHTIEAGDPEGIFKRVRGRENRARRLGMFEFNKLVAEDSREEPSAESKALDSKGRLARYNDILDLFQKKLRKIYELHAQYEGLSEEEIDISIPRDFGLDDPEAVISKRSVVFSQAGQLGAVDVQKQVLKQGVNELRVIPDEGEKEEETRAKLMQSVDTATSPAERVRSVTSSLFGDFDAAPAQ